MDKNKRTGKRKFKLRYLIILFALVYLSAIFINQRELKKDLEAKESEVQDDISTLEEEIGELSLEIEKKDSIEFLENTARKELGMLKPNEIIYIDKNRFENSIFNFMNKIDLNEANDWHKLVSNIYLSGKYI